MTEQVYEPEIVDLRTLSIEELLRMGYDWEFIFGIQGYQVPELIKKSTIARIEIKSLILNDDMSLEEAMNKVQAGLNIRTEPEKEGVLDRVFKGSLYIRAIPSWIWVICGLILLAVFWEKKDG